MKRLPGSRIWAVPSRKENLTSPLTARPERLSAFSLLLSSSTNSKSDERKVESTASSPGAGSSG